MEKSKRKRNKISLFFALKIFTFPNQREPLSLCVVAQFINKYEPYQFYNLKTDFRKQISHPFFSIDTPDITMLHWNHRGQAEALFVLCWLSGSVQNSVHHDNSFCCAVWCLSFLLISPFLSLKCKRWSSAVLGPSLLSADCGYNEGELSLGGKGSTMSLPVLFYLVSSFLIYWSWTYPVTVAQVLGWESQLAWVQ